MPLSKVDRTENSIQSKPATRPEQLKMFFIDLQLDPNTSTRNLKSKKLDSQFSAIMKKKINSKTNFIFYVNVNMSQLIRIQIYSFFI